MVVVPHAYSYFTKTDLNIKFTSVRDRDVKRISVLWVSFGQRLESFVALRLIELKPRCDIVMVAIPTVKSFLGCFNLRVTCVIIASFQLHIFIGFLVIKFSDILFPAYINKTEGGVDQMVWSTISTTFILLNIAFPYWFIRGIILVNFLSSSGNKQWNENVFHFVESFE